MSVNVETLDNQRLNSYDKSIIHIKRSTASMVTTKAKTQKSSQLINRENKHHTLKSNIPQTNYIEGNLKQSGMQFPYDTKYRFFKNEVNYMTLI